MAAKKPLSLLIAINMLFVLGACGGGGGSSSSSSPVISSFAVKVFEDDAGVAIATVVSDNRKSLILSPVIVDVVSNLNSADSFNNVDYSTLSLSGTTATSEIYTGAVTLDGIGANVTEYRDNSGDAKLMFLEVPSTLNLVQTQGAALNGIPSGTYTYNGVHGFGRRVVGTTIETGNFSMSANFTNKTFTYSGTTNSSTLSGSGSIDTSAGRFTSTGMTLNAPLGNYTATLNGLLHGTNASAVSGVYHTNDTYPDYAGAFVGAR